MNILVVAGNNYPSNQEPQKGTFVYKLIQEFVKQGHKVIVFAPYKMFYSKSENELNYGIETAKVLRPKYFSMSNKQILGFNTYSIGRKNLVRELKKTYDQLDIDVVYAHFTANALIAVEALYKYNVPVFAAVGEYKNIDITKAYYKKKEYQELIQKISGFIAVSPQVRSKLLDIGIMENKIIIAPNGADFNIFKPLDRISLRKKYHLPLDKKIVLFIGRFTENKGPLRVLGALNQLPDDVVGVFIGKGEREPCGEKVIYKGMLPHHSIPEIMATADVFVLPTFHEGSSNVIVEAMACGLPIISSKIPEIEFQCNPTFSILIDPLVVNDIKIAITDVLIDNEKRKKMSLEALRHSKNFDLKTRAARILSFIDQNTE
jgi:teichuronic acid biosynthesis glycosyltransferase TuaC